jgi:hypothetical protein
MASLIGSEYEFDKPSRLINISYYFFGFALASVIIQATALSFNEKLSFILILGSAVGTFVYYVKPVERVMSVYLWIRDLNMVNFGKSFSATNKELKFDRRTLLGSPLLKEDLALVTGAYLFAVSIIFSIWLQGLVNLSIPAWIFVAISLVMWVVAIWETRLFLRQKVDCVLYYQYFKRFERPAAKEILDAIVNKDWVGALNIISRTSDRGSVFALQGGFCINCGGILRRDGPYCYNCGKPLIASCTHCRASIVREGIEKAPTFCFNCGKSLLETNEIVQAIS